jgi:membrane protein DedA with SNARE-associated domain
MGEWLSLTGPLASWVQHWGYLAVFLGILMENAGVPVPGETVIIVASVMAAQGLLKLEFIYPAVVLGATLGGCLGYWVGRRGGRPLLVRLGSIWRIKETQIDQAEQAFSRHGGWAVFVGRFIMLLRILAGPLAGMLRMPWGSYFLWNLLGALLWAAVMIGLSYIFGTHVSVVFHHLGLGLLVLVTVAVAYFALRHWLDRRLG